MPKKAEKKVKSPIQIQCHVIYYGNYFWQIYYSINLCQSQSITDHDALIHSTTASTGH